MLSDAESTALDCLAAGIEDSHPQHVVEDMLEVDGQRLIVNTVNSTSKIYNLDEYENIFVLGGGNAAAHFATALESLLGDYLDGGSVVTDDPVETDTIDVLLGDHPVPSERGVENTKQILDLAEQSGPDDLVIGCITGGGSALLSAPADNLSLADLQETTETLLASGVPIEEINIVRKHLSKIKGGHLARKAAPATVLGLAISDVVGNNQEIIASGPFSPDSTSFNDAIEVINQNGLDIPFAVWTHLQMGAEGEYPDTPTKGDYRFDDVAFYVIASAHTALDSSREVALEQGYTPLVLSSRIRGEASETAKTHAAIAEEVAYTSNLIEPPAIILSGGETTVTLGDDHGCGGPNQEFVLSTAFELETSAVVSAVDTDGIDGSTDAAGAIADDETVDDKIAKDALRRNDAYTVMEDTNSLLKTGATGTNVNDLRVIVIPS